MSSASTHSMALCARRHSQVNGHGRHEPRVNHLRNTRQALRLNYEVRVIFLNLSILLNGNLLIPYYCFSGNAWSHRRFPTYNFGYETPSVYAWPFPPLLVTQNYGKLNCAAKKENSDKYTLIMPYIYRYLSYRF